MIKATLSWLKRFWLPLALIAGATILFGDGAQLATVIYCLSMVALVLIAVDFILDRRKDLGIFPTLDMDQAIANAAREPLSAAILVAAIVALLITILLVCVPSARAAELDRARPYLPILSQSLDRNWPGAPLRQIPAGQVEQESSWKERATLKTSRELGRGLVQMTIAFDSRGKERFNIYRDAVRARALAAWDWQSDPYNPRYQLTFLAIQDRGNFQQVRRFCVDDAQAWKCALVCYNAGSGRWLNRRAQAKLRGIPADRWDGGLDRAWSKGEAALLYDRPLWQAVNEYPKVIFRRSEKYAGLV